MLKLPCSSDCNLEIGCVSLYNDQRGSIYVVTVYRPPKGNLKEALNSLDADASYVKGQRKNSLIIHGDFNINYTNSKCKWTAELKAWKHKYDLEQLVRCSTRVDAISSTVIDLCFTDLNYVKNSGVLMQTLSDHLPTFLLKKKSKRTKITKDFVGRDYSKLDADQIERCLESTIPSMDDTDPNLIWNEIQIYLEKVADLVCPVSNFHIRDNKPPYLTGIVGREMSLRDRLFPRARRKPLNKILWLRAHKQKYKV